ncbi:MAG: alginate lyase family protein [Rhodospirillaceae bacterium]|jgi:hypothetical protein|nr:alginate lyase family protein [Rhodospirillaceae bacterium]MBT8005395.1 alginate lyase family protein [Rhodospirillales bacterium]MBT4703716.1 alginate lyase family protein [Rhodospirillaceae bacterium]MBT5035841.1 alginate lyase family protein [Rhodospirillaceae bacterium]MBT6221995.1 alginate lyase family protein [Rhodospirillaceae bacterium]
MSLKHLITHARSMPIGAAVAKGSRVIGRTILGQSRQLLTKGRDTFGDSQALREIATYVPGLPPDVTEPQAEALAALCQHYLGHRFDLLGSGWVTVSHGMAALGFERQVYKAPQAPTDLTSLLNPGNRSHAQKIRAQIAADYVPIDWQIDFKSGYRWQENHVSSRLQYGHEPGVDIKVPWELARLQHLPQLAVAYAACRMGLEGFETIETYQDEFQNQVLDFIAANPPGFGVNWFSAMDVAIRAANLLIAFDLFKRHDAKFDLKFTAEFSTSILAHGRFVAANLSTGHRANHYLTEICGLLFVAAYLPATTETDGWLAEGIRELTTEVKRQFMVDGGNFEGSTNYHRLSGEAVLYATALVLGLPENRRTEPFEPGYTERLERLAEFTQHVTKPSGHAIQIGDTDDGRFIKLCPPVRDGREDILDHRSLVGAANGLFRRQDFTRTAGLHGYIDATIIGGLADGTTAPSSLAAGALPPAQDRPITTVGDLDGAPPQTSREVVITLPDTGPLFGLKNAAYPEFGLYLWWSRRLFLSVRCGGLNNDGLGAHAHNDQLSVELQIDGVDWLADPGSYIYTPTPKHRNLYRSAIAHNGPKLPDIEPARLDLGLFKLEDSSDAKCLHFEGTGFFGYYTGYGVPVSRLIAIGRDRIVIRDSFGSVRPAPADSAESVDVTSANELRNALAVAIPFSPGYGKVLTGE